MLHVLAGMSHCNKTLSYPFHIKCKCSFPPKRYIHVLSNRLKIFISACSIAPPYISVTYLTFAVFHCSCHPSRSSLIWGYSSPSLIHKMLSPRHSAVHLLTLWGKERREEQDWGEWNMFAIWDSYLDNSSVFWYHQVSLLPGYSL